MCGIVAAIGKENVIPALVEGLQRLEYRGYDSCGLAVIAGGILKRYRTTQRVADLMRLSASKSSTIGIAHTRWATHGRPDEINAHPHFSASLISVVHNGIIENHEVLRAELQRDGYIFYSQTDTEVIAHLVHREYGRLGQQCLAQAVSAAIPKLKGAYAIAVMSKNEPGRLVCAKHGSPLVVAQGQAVAFAASDALAIAGRADAMMFLEDGDVALLEEGGVVIRNAAGKVVPLQWLPVPAYVATADLGPHRHYMHKEIFEQTMAVADTLAGVEGADASAFGVKARDWSRVEGVLMLACGTSHYASQVAKYWIEDLAGIPVSVEVASEYRYRKSVANPKQLVVVVSQSGETADTLAALRHAKSLGHTKTLAICNVKTSTMVREAGAAFFTMAGAEIGVASTKAFTTQLVGLYLLAMTLAKVRGCLSPEKESEGVTRLRHLPAAINSVLALESQIKALADEFARYENAIFLGRGAHYPIALEGALKLKETSYIHAEAYPAGELKHGPLALIDERVPVVTVAPNDHLLEKLKSNMQEVRARGGLLYVFADADSHVSESDAHRVIRLPEHYGDLSPILSVIPLQMMAYHVACARGTDVDKPRNLAKSVTVE